VASDVQWVILVADDDEEDYFLAKEALEASGAKADLSTVEKEMELMDCLLESFCSKSNKFPSLILLDLNMPRLALNSGL
jgi:CheY-like chemotaxis protein